METKDKAELELEGIFAMLSMHGVSRERAITATNGLDVLLTRIGKERECLQWEIADLKKAAPTPEEVEKVEEALNKGFLLSMTLENEQLFIKALAIVEGWRKA